MPPPFHPGQRWISESEPELGLGSVLRVEDRTLTVIYPASGESRQYAVDNSPLRRVRFRAGDEVRSRDGTVLAVESVDERDRLIYYRAGQCEVCESDLSDAIGFNQPHERLRSGRVDSTDLFDLRLAALRVQHRRRQSAVRGFVGGRIDLIPHQLSIAGEVAGRLAPRVLLADEVGLGKTIEACLILHRLIHTGRAARVLVLVPESLVHQWFIELLRRFNLWFHIFDEGRCAAIQAVNPDANPFLDDQCIVSSLRLLSADPLRLQQALEAGWDLVVVDEAHHLGWAPGSVSREYAVVEALGRRSPGLLLLTATPEQLGMTSHFARLRLLDPARFHDLNEFLQEAEGYRAVARLADQLLRGVTLGTSEVSFLASILGNGSGASERASRTSEEREELVSALLDRHGTGRVMFRNTRSAVAGFPRRVVHLHVLDLPPGSTDLLDALAEEFSADADETIQGHFEPRFIGDPRLEWLVGLLRSLRDAKVLLLCRTQAKVEALDAALRSRINLKMAAFHEGLSLVQRDRHAAWFAEEDGARLLLCSEIGGEGRNFQFSHHLVLFDLPLDPELLEQRIGRLDRIGQDNDIQIHVPFVKGSAQEVLARWFHEGLNSFERNLQGGREILERFGRSVHDLAIEFHEAVPPARSPGDRSGPNVVDRAALLTRLIADTGAARQELSERLEHGRDRLLELNSFRPAVAGLLVREIARCDADTDLEDFMLEVFDHFSIHVEQLGPRTYQLGSAGVFADSFPGLPAEGMTVTADRTRALSREDIQFLTSDHPLVTGALDLLLGDEKGNCSVAFWCDPKTSGLYLETVHVLESIAPPRLHVDRFLPPTPIRVLVDHRGIDAGDLLPTGLSRRILKSGPVAALLDDSGFREELLPQLLEKSLALALRPVAGLIQQARKTMVIQLDHEIVRLTELRRVNPSVRPEEVGLLVEQRDAIDHSIASARLRLDALRLIQRGSR